jgi:nucleolar protein 58
MVTNCHISTRHFSQMVGELVGARLIAHAGSLLNLAKHPASTIQILGAEKALFRALKTKHDTPKYGLIYHASLIGQAAPKNKGKISRVLAAKTALAIRVDAMGDNTGPTIAIENKIKVEARIRQLEGGQKAGMATNGSKQVNTVKYDPAAARALAPPKFNDASDIVIKAEKKEKKKAAVEEEAPKKKSKKDKEAVEEVEVADVETKKKKKKAAAEEEEEESEPAPKKKSKKDRESVAPADEEEAPVEDGEGKKKKKKKDKSSE